MVPEDAWHERVNRRLGQRPKRLVCRLLYQTTREADITSVWVYSLKEKHGWSIITPLTLSSVVVSQVGWHCKLVHISLLLLSITLWEGTCTSLPYCCSCNSFSCCVSFSSHDQKGSYTSSPHLPVLNTDNCFDMTKRWGPCVPPGPLHNLPSGCKRPTGSVDDVQCVSRHVKSNLLKIGINELDQKCAQIKVKKLMQSKNSGSQNTLVVRHMKSVRIKTGSYIEQSLFRIFVVKM